MRAFSSMPAEDFVYQLRTIAINAKASPLVIDQIDGLDTLTDLEIELEETNAAKGKIEDARDELWNELDDLIRALELHQSDIREEVSTCMVCAKQALERHK